MRISDWSSDVCSSDLAHVQRIGAVFVVRKTGGSRGHRGGVAESQAADRVVGVADMNERAGVVVAEIGTHAAEVVAEAPDSIAIALAVELPPQVRLRVQRHTAVGLGLAARAETGPTLPAVRLAATSNTHAPHR